MVAPPKEMAGGVATVMVNVRLAAVCPSAVAV